MFIYYDTATKTIPAINLYLLLNLAGIVLALGPAPRRPGRRLSRPPGRR
jgi:hypothetical protein